MIEFCAKQENEGKRERRYINKSARGVPFDLFLSFIYTCGARERPRKSERGIVKGFRKREREREILSTSGRNFVCRECQTKERKKEGRK